MRGIKRFVLLVAVNFYFFGLLSGMTAMKAEAGDYIGEVCWNTKKNGEIVGAFKFGITHMGGNYYSIQGVSSDLKRYSSGSGQVVGNKIVFSMSGTSSNVEKSLNIRRGSFEEITVDLITLNGSFWGIATVYREDGTYNVDHYEGTVEHISCQ